MVKDGKTYNILYLHNESIMGGAEISLLNLVKRLDKELFTPHFACSKDNNREARRLDRAIEK